MENDRETATESWFAAQLKPNGLSQARRNLERQGFGVFMPLCAPPAGGPRRRVPLFPGYIFVSFDPAGTAWRSINATRGVARLITTDIRAPTPLPAAFIDGLKACCDPEGQFVAPPEDLAPGDAIRVVSGPFADLLATVDRLAPDRRIEILVSLLDRTVSVPLRRDQVRKL